MADGASIAKTVRTYIDKRPVVRDALRMGIVNLSALTRHIQEETGLTKDEAILVACRRYADKAQPEGYEQAIRRVLDGSKLEVRTRVAVWTLRPSWRLISRLGEALREQATAVHLLNGSEAVTLILDQSLGPALEGILSTEDVHKKREGLVEVNLRTPSRIEDVEGILAFVSSALAARGVNFLEVISCHKDNMFIIDEDDLFTAFEVLNELIRP